MERKKLVRTLALVCVAAVLLCGCTGSSQPPRTSGDFGLETTIMTEGGVQAVCWAENDTRLLAVTVEGKVHAYDTSTYRRMTTISEPGATLYSASVSPGGDLVALLKGGSPTDIMVFDVMDGRMVRKLGTGLVATVHDEAEHLAWSPDGSRLALGLSSGGVMVWDFPSSTRLHNLKWPALLHSTSGGAVAWSPDGLRLVSTDGRDSKVWNAANGSILRGLNGMSGTSMAWSTNGTVLAFSGRSQTQFVDTRDWHFIRNITYGSGSLPAQASNRPLSPDLRFVAVGEETTRGYCPVSVLNATSGAQEKYLVSHVQGVHCAAWSRGSDRLATAASREIKLWSHDEDRDMYADVVDRFPEDRTQWNDTDRDGFGDNQNGRSPDVFPQDPREWKDTDKDGMGDNGDPLPGVHNELFMALVGISAAVAAMTALAIRWLKRRRLGKASMPEQAPVSYQPYPARPGCEYPDPPKRP